ARGANPGGGPSRGRLPAPGRRCSPGSAGGGMERRPARAGGPPGARASAAVPSAPRAPARRGELHPGRPLRRRRDARVAGGEAAVGDSRTGDGRDAASAAGTLMLAPFLIPLLLAVTPATPRFDAAGRSIGAPLSERTASYVLEARYDPARRQVDGTARLTWTNRSAVPQSTLWFHAYWNAFKNADSTFAREAIRGGGVRSDTGGFGRRRRGWAEARPARPPPGTPRPPAPPRGRPRRPHAPPPTPL